MRIALKVIHLTVTAVVATALGASAAQAQETAAAVKHEDGSACNPCVVHIVGEFSIFAPAEVMRCNDEFTVRLYTTGGGELEWTGTSKLPPNTGPGCNSTNCTALPGEPHWPVSGVGEKADGTAHMTVRFCFSGRHCNGEFQVTEPSLHEYRISLNQNCPPLIAGIWNIEANPDLELDHTP